MISDRDLAVIARNHLTDWESLAPFLGLSIVQKEEIAKSYPGDYGMQKEKCLQVWKEMKGEEVTYQALISAAEEAKNQLLADNVKDLCVPSRGAEDAGKASSRA